MSFCWYVSVPSFDAVAVCLHVRISVCVLCTLVCVLTVFRLWNFFSFYCRIKTIARASVCNIQNSPTMLPPPLVHAHSWNLLLLYHHYHHLLYLLLLLHLLLLPQVKSKCQVCIWHNSVQCSLPCFIELLLFEVTPTTSTGKRGYRLSHERYTC